MLLYAKKWQKISDELRKYNLSPSPRDGPSRKNKWNQMILEYKQLVDFFSRSGTNELSYWTMSLGQRQVQHLPKAFPKIVFTNLRDWYNKRLTINPPHVHDLMSPHNSNYVTAPVDHSHNALTIYIICNIHHL